MKPQRWTAHGGVAALALGYLAGTLPSADLASRFASTADDLRETGTGNPGALNAGQVLGAKWGLAVLGADMAKGYGATLVGGAVAGPVGANLAGTSAVVGHCYPVWADFRGGKGVATSVGQVLGTFPVYFPIDAAVAFSTAAVPWFKHRTFAATAVASAVWIAATTTWHRRGWPNPGGVGTGWSLPVSAAVSSAVIARRFLEEGRPS